MSELDDALQRLERAIARLESVSDPGRRAAKEAQLAAIAASAAERVDAALAKLGQLLEREN